MDCRPRGNDDGILLKMLSQLSTTYSDTIVILLLAILIPS